MERLDATLLNRKINARSVRWTGNLYGIVIDFGNGSIMITTSGITELQITTQKY